MNRSVLPILTLLCVCILLVYGCGGSMTNPLRPGASALSVTITDTPPTGVSVLSFEVSVTGATLNPGSVDLLAGRGPVEIEVEQLETESAFLNTARVNPGTYTSLNLTFANPELTFKNGSTMTLAACAPGAVCEIKPTGTLTAMVNFPAPGLVIQGSTTSSDMMGEDDEQTAMGIKLDLDLNTILTGTLGVDFSQTGAVTVKQLVREMEGEFDDVNELKGTVQNLNSTNMTFTLRTMNGDFSITTDSNTQFEFQNCTANNFSCLQNNMVVEVDALMMPGGIFLAREISFEDDAEDDELEGVVSKIDDAMHFEMVVLDELRSVNNINVGNPVVVTLSNPSFQVQTEEFNPPSALVSAFQSATDTSQLLVGQTVEIRLTAPATPGPPISVTADRVRLRMTQLTANVSGAPTPPTFMLGNLPSLFTGAGITSIQVDTSSETDFDNVAGVSGLADTDLVSVRGLLFNNGANPPVLVAKKVRKR
jgi:predicted component of type VI protein secretion system